MHIPDIWTLLILPFRIETTNYGCSQPILSCKFGGINSIYDTRHNGHSTVVSSKSESHSHIREKDHLYLILVSVWSRIIEDCHTKRTGNAVNNVLVHKLH